jgi:aspartate dehydrogenase
MTGKRHIGIIGYGAIGQNLATCLIGQPDYRVTVLTRSEPATGGRSELAFLTSFQDFLADPPDLVVEAASAEAFRTLVPSCLEKGITVLAASVGALNNPGSLQHIAETCARTGARLILPSGAVGGLDYLAAVALVDDLKVVYTSRKPIAAWSGELAALGLQGRAQTEAITLFEGSATQAAALYPKNLNAGLTIALCVGISRTFVRVVADPSVVENTHEIEVTSAAGRAQMRFENKPSPANPKTSMITAFSLASAVFRQFATLQQG